jgi:hypothetical protein
MYGSIGRDHGNEADELAGVDSANGEGIQRLDRRSLADGGRVMAMHKKGNPERIPINEHINWIESLLFDRDEPGCVDTDRGDVYINGWGRIQLAKRLKQIRKEGKLK